LKKLGFTEIAMSFAEIERVVGEKLPPSAFKHRPWWSNNPSNSVITYAWLAAGYKTAQVDMEGMRLIFRKRPDAGPESAVASPAPSRGVEETGRSFETDTPHRNDIFSALYGAMKNTIKFAKAFDPCEPAWGENEAKAFDEKWDRLLSPAKPVDKIA
jgi:hypothetical protein